MPCQRCISDRIILVSAKCSDCCNCEINGHESDGYVPEDVLFGEGGWGGLRHLQALPGLRTDAG